MLAAHPHTVKLSLFLSLSLVSLGCSPALIGDGVRFDGSSIDRDTCSIVFEEIDLSRTETHRFDFKGVPHGRYGLDLVSDASRFAEYMRASGNSISLTLLDARDKQLIATGGDTTRMWTVDARGTRFGQNYYSRFEVASLAPEDALVVIMTVKATSGTTPATARARLVSYPKVWTP